MKKTTIILFLFAFFAISCNQPTRNRAETAKSESSYEEKDWWQQHNFCLDSLSTAARLQMQKTDCLLEKTIIKTLLAYVSEDEATLNSLIHSDFGIAFLFRRGATHNAAVADSISFANPIPEYLPYDVWFKPDFTIRFGALPEFCWLDIKWNKPSGIYIDTINVDTSLSRIAKFEKKHEIKNWSACDIKRFQEIEQKSHKVIAVGETPGAFIFWLAFIENKWYLTIIDRFEL